MQKRGWMRIVEASIAIILILSVLFTLYTRTYASSEPDLSQTARDILEEVAVNATLREAIVRNDQQQVNAAISNMIKDRNLEYEIKICEVDDVCGKSTFSAGNVYAADRVIGAALYTGSTPKKVRLFIWR